MRKVIYSISTFLTGIMAMLTVGIANNIASSLDVPSKSLGVLVTIYTLTFAISGPILNTVINRFNDKIVIICSLIIFSGGNFLAFLSQNLMILIISRGITAIGAATLVVRLLNQASIITESGSILTTVYMGFSLANAIGLPLSTFAAQYLNWRYVFLVIAVIATGVTIIFVLNADNLVLKKAPIIVENGSHLEDKGTIESFKFVSIIVITMLVLAANANFVTYLSSFSQKLGYSNQSLTISMFVLGIGSLVGSKIGGNLSDKKNPQNFYKLALLLFLGSSFLMLCLAKINIILFWIVLFLWNVTQWITGPLGVMLITRLTEKYRDTALSLNTTAQNLGASLGSFSGQIFLKTNSIVELPVISALFLIVSLVILLISKIQFDNASK